MHTCLYQFFGKIDFDISRRSFSFARCEYTFGKLIFPDRSCKIIFTPFTFTNFFGKIIIWWN